MNAIQLSIFSSRIESVCDEMGAILQRAAFSPNIKDRLDFSCAVFDVEGGLCAQAAHIPVHLGSMAYAMQDIVNLFDWQVGDMVALNDPYLGGTHLPDVTLICPLFVEGRLLGFVANRAHHSDIGAEAPGSMPLSTSLSEEGLIIPPIKIIRNRERTVEFTELLEKLSHSVESTGDFNAQISANWRGVERLAAIVNEYGTGEYEQAICRLNEYGERLMTQLLKSIPNGQYCFSDVMDDDGLGTRDILIQLALTVDDDKVMADFAGTAPQVIGNINCPLSVVAAAVYYVFRCLMPDNTPACSGVFKRITIRAEKGSLINAIKPAAVAAGNVETSTRMVDVVMGALAQAIPEKIPAASHGSMNNVAMGARNADVNWSYYETIGGGMGAGISHDGLSAVQTHMTNTLNTPVESLEMHYPLRMNRYEIRRGSGGEGRHVGGNGLLREMEFLSPAQVTLLTERRQHKPWGLQGGGDGDVGRNLLNGQPLPAKTSIKVVCGDRLTVITPGGGGYGEKAADS
ncbi:MAG: 5-oxoprolinase [Piscirickettsiaceae bacterium]|nr:MAG: 5-oxoprolinase [Piscirickettsiaceae bacterium]PCI69495.1 MAG: 5-oxoprolinase [Piscirickettsiaceae bacterium]